jgi:hypothetical protein
MLLSVAGAIASGKKSRVGIGKYYVFTVAGGSWYDVRNWYTDINGTQGAAYLPSAQTEVVITYPPPPEIDIGDPRWIEPLSITIDVSEGYLFDVTFYSLNVNSINCNLFAPAGTRFILEGQATFGSPQ